MDKGELSLNGRALKILNRFSDSDELKQEQAVTVIQAAFRGYGVRKYFQAESPQSQVFCDVNLVTKIVTALNGSSGIFFVNKTCASLLNIKVRQFKDGNIFDNLPLRNMETTDREGGVPPKEGTTFEGVIKSAKRGPVKFLRVLQRFGVNRYIFKGLPIILDDDCLRCDQYVEINKETESTYAGKVEIDVEQNISCMRLIDRSPNTVSTYTGNPVLINNMGRYPVIRCLELIIKSGNVVSTYTGNPVRVSHDGDISCTRLVEEWESNKKNCIRIIFEGTENTPVEIYKESISCLQLTAYDSNGSVSIYTGTEQYPVKIKGKCPVKSQYSFVRNEDSSPYDRYSWWRVQNEQFSQTICCQSHTITYSNGNIVTYIGTSEDPVTCSNHEIRCLKMIKNNGRVTYDTFFNVKVFATLVKCDALKVMCTSLKKFLKDGRMIEIFCPDLIVFQPYSADDLPIPLECLTRIDYLPDGTVCRYDGSPKNPVVSDESDPRRVIKYLKMTKDNSIHSALYTL